MQRWTQMAAGNALPLRGRLGSAGWGWWGKSWHLMDRLCVFSSEHPLHPTRGISNSSPGIVLRIFADHPAAPKTFKGRKERSSCCWPTGYIYSGGVNMLLWNGLCQQQDVWQSQRHISGTDMLENSFAFYLFITVERWARAVGQQVKDLPVCE